MGKFGEIPVLQKECEERRHYWKDNITAKMNNMNKNIDKIAKLVSINSTQIENLHENLNNYMQESKNKVSWRTFTIIISGMATIAILVQVFTYSQVEKLVSYQHEHEIKDDEWKSGVNSRITSLETLAKDLPSQIIKELQKNYNITH